jgi:hypothetical protein
MSDRKQEERIKFLTETFKVLVTIFLALTGGLAFLGRVTYPESNSSGEAFDNVLLVLGAVLDAFIIIAIFGVWFEIKKEIKKL